MANDDLNIQDLGDVKGLFDNLSKATDKEKERRQNELKDSYPGQEPAIHPTQSPSNQIPDQMKVNTRYDKKNIPPDSITSTP